MKVRIGSRWFVAPEFTRKLPEGQRAQLAGFLKEILAAQQKAAEAGFAHKHAVPDFLAEMLNGGTGGRK